ncbi:MAG: hypothetical protein LBQ89_04865 [Treponema sp.]|nr:hypothetical protein [Treponema sp.]
MAIERTRKAKEHFDRASELKRNVAKTDYAKMIAEYDKVIKLLPDDAESYKWRGLKTL